jgi:hybrid cluster-associated redox disulfide protein
MGGYDYMAKVTGDMIIRDVLLLDEGTAPIFMKHGMHCLFCPSASAESIEDACVVHGIEPKKLIGDLNEYLEGK